MYMLWKQLLAISLNSLNDRKQPTDFFSAPISDFSAHLNGAREIRVVNFYLLLPISRLKSIYRSEFRVSNLDLPCEFNHQTMISLLASKNSLKKTAASRPFII